MQRIDETLKRISPPSGEVADAMRARLDSLTKPRGSLGALEGLAVTVAGALGLEITREALSARVPFTKRICVAAADHGVHSEGVSAFPQEVTAQMVANFLVGGAAINALSARAGADVEVIDCGVASEIPAVGGGAGVVSTPVAKGTANIAAGPAMSRQEAMESISLGLDAAKRASEAGVEFLGGGDMGIANTTASTAMIAAVTGLPVTELTGAGAGLPAKDLARKAGVIEKALTANEVDPEDPIDLLAKLGGFEIGFIAGLCLGGAAEGLVVFVDGLISSAGAYVAWELSPDCRDYLVWSHASVEPAHSALLRHMEAKALVDLGMRLGEGTGAALAMWLAETAVATAAGMATFGEAGVSDA